MNFFRFGEILLNFSGMFAAYHGHEKSFFVPAFFKVSIDNFESGKRNYCFVKKSPRDFRK